MKQEQIMGIIRHALSAIGGLASYKGWLNAEESEQLIGILLLVVATLWSVAAKK
jgi:hypothetical protein